MTNENCNNLNLLEERKEQLIASGNKSDLMLLEIIEAIDNLPIKSEIKTALLTIACFELVFSLSFLRIILKCGEGILEALNYDENSRIEVLNKLLSNILELHIRFVNKLTSHPLIHKEIKNYKFVPIEIPNLNGSFYQIISFIKKRVNIPSDESSLRGIIPVLKSFEVLVPIFNSLLWEINVNYGKYQILKTTTFFDFQSKDWLKKLVMRANIHMESDESLPVLVKKDMNLKSFASLGSIYQSDILEKYCFILKSNNISDDLFKDRIIELAKKVNLFISDEDVSVTIVKKILDLNKYKLILNLEELLELKQYYSILTNDLYFNFFIDDYAKEFYDSYFKTNYFLSECIQDSNRKRKYVSLLKNEDLNINPLNKKEVFMKEYYQIAFKHIVIHCMKLGYIFIKYDLDDFFINGVNGLALFQYENIKILSSNILRCDDCHHQVDPDFEPYLTSSARSQESSFKCPNCGRTYKYSDLMRIFFKNCHNSYY